MKIIHIEYDDEVCGGEWVFEGTRLVVKQIAAMIQRGAADEILEDYPYLNLTPDDIEKLKTADLSENQCIWCELNRG